MRPNILILYTDQQRWDTLGINGNPHIHTPHLDQLGRSSVSFDHCFVQNPLCMPSRASFLTGRYPSNLGITHMGVNVPEDTVTIAHRLGQYGYNCANLGKLHFRTHANQDHTAAHPMYGFDHLEISDEPGVYEDAYRAWVRREAPEQLPHLSVGLPPATVTWQDTMQICDRVSHPSAEPRADFTRAIPFPGDEHYTHTAFVANRTIEFLQRQHNGPQPFLCISGFYSPHAPWVVPQRFLDLYDRDQLSLPRFTLAENEQRQQMGWSDDYLREAKHGYYAMISEVDHHIGRIINTLRQTGQLENTIILFTSDHGEWLGEHLQFGKGYPGDDGATRVPLLVSGAGIEARGVHNELIEAVDVLPTLLDIAAIQPAPELNGRSFAPLLLGRDYQSRTSALTEFSGWKSLRTQTHRYLVHEDGRERLWRADNVELDAQAHPDIITDCRHQLLQRMIEAERPLARTWPY